MAFSHDAPPMGARDAAIISLNVADYEPQTGVIVIRAGKRNKDRRVYAPSGTIAALDVWLDDVTQAPYLGGLYVRNALILSQTTSSCDSR